MTSFRKWPWFFLATLFFQNLLAANLNTDPQLVIDHLENQTGIELNSRQRQNLIDATSRLDTQDGALFIQEYFDLEFAYTNSNQEELAQEKARDHIRQMNQQMRDEYERELLLNFSDKGEDLIIERLTREALLALPFSDSDKNKFKESLESYVLNFYQNIDQDTTVNSNTYDELLRVMTSEYHAWLTERYEIFKTILSSGPKTSPKNDIGYPPFPRRTLDHVAGTSAVEKFDARVKLGFMGVEISAGPSIEFSRKHTISAKLMATGRDPLLIGVGGSAQFNHSEDRRIVYFCSASSQVSHNLSASASLSVFGTGASLERGAWEELNSGLTSELRYIPFTQEDGHLTTLKDILDECRHKFFPEVADSLNAELKLAVSGMTYSHKKMQCLEDRHCRNWHSQRIGIIQSSTRAECHESDEFRAPVRLCRLVSRKGGACSYYNRDGERLTAGYFEYPCAEGLECRVTQRGGWFTQGSLYAPWKASCQ